MIHIAQGQDLRHVYWEPVEAADWLTACEPLPGAHRIVNAIEWQPPDIEEPLPADADILAGRVHSFDSMEELIASLKRPD